MRYINGKLIFSPSDLVVFAESEFASWMDRCHKEDPSRFAMDEADPLMLILGEKGATHEAKVYERLKTEARSFADLRGGDLEHTIRAMKEGVELIYQAGLTHGPFAGVADFLRRIPGQSAFGNYCYEVWDSKLARTAKTSALLQLCTYTDILEAIQGVRAEHFGLILGKGNEERFRVSDFFYYYAMLKSRFLGFQDSFNANQRPAPADSRSFGKWSDVATAIFEEEESLFQVAHITRLQVKRFNKTGLKRMTDLAKSTAGSIPGVNKDVHQRLIEQAQLQLASKGKDKPEFKLLPADGSKLAQLPQLNPGDIFFDMEGYPLDENGIEYLWGYVYLQDGKPIFDCIWAHNAEGERRAVEKFIDYAHDRWLKFPGMHVYHYASYETRAVKTLAQRYGTCLDKLDDLLRNEIFVDLYDTVRGSLMLGAESYSIKKLELLYRDKRQSEVTSAMASVVYYQTWLNLNASDQAGAAKVLEDIRIYNKDDCDSTFELAIWLDAQKKMIGICNPTLAEVRPPESTPPELVALMQKLEKMGPVGQLMGHLIGHDKREDNVSWWEHFANLKAPVETLLNDPDVIAGVSYNGSAPGKVDRSLSYQFTFDPSQPLEVEEGQSFIFSFGAKPRNVTILQIDLEGGTLLAKTTEKDVPPLFNLLPPRETVKSLDEHILAEAQAYSEGKVHQALDHFLHRRAPQLKAGVSLPKNEKETTVENIIKVIAAMEGSSLVIQGPPGAGKTYVGAQAIAALCRAGKKVGITSNAHKAIDHLLVAVNQLLEGSGLGVLKINKLDYSPAPTNIDVKPRVESLEGYSLIGGTAWAFIRDVFEGSLDYLFIDEASQVSLSKLVACAKAAKNFVFLGDQMQLSQPSRASHPGESGQSCLEYFLQDHATIPADKGIFLPLTRRMHPTLCALVSDTVYEGRLHSHPTTEERFLIRHSSSMIPKIEGVLYVPVEHQANRQSSQEEAACIRELVDEILQMKFQTAPGQVRSLSSKDILIVAPYNQQVRLLRRTLGEDFLIGSVDKFQGQEAPIVILSLGTSSAHDAPRGLDFVFNRNRLNVALSRAQSLAIVVGCPGLSLSFAASPKQMSLVNFFCRIVHQGSQEVLAKTKAS